jgi:hypothetical protein
MRPSRRRFAPPQDEESRRFQTSPVRVHLSPLILRRKIRQDRLEGRTPTMKFRLNLLPFLNRVEKAALSAVESEVEWFCLPAGQTLFEEGEPADAFYLVRSGALAAFRTGADGRPELVGHVRKGEPIGEMALVEDRPIPPASMPCATASWCACPRARLTA